MSRETLAFVRAILGVAQGAALYLLYNAATAMTLVDGDILSHTPMWPATNAQVFAPLQLTAVFVPALAIAGLGNLRLRTFAIWIAAATVIVAALGAYDVFRDPGDLSAMRPRPPEPSFPLWVATAAGLFIGHALVVSGDADRAWIARYPRYFEVAWKQAVQVALAGIFLGAVSMLLLIFGAGLLGAIHFRLSGDPWRTPWFTFLITALAFALALHVTDVQAAIVRGARVLTLTLLSWLLVLSAAMAAGLLATLLITGLDPLWGTHRATSVVLGTAAALIVLINAAYQDGSPRALAVAVVLRSAGIVAAAALTPLVVIAAYAVILRVTQYGWTPARVIAIACVAVAGCYAIGYGLAMMSRPWLRWLETANVIASIVILTAILALFSPAADPIRIAVADQVARLESGRTPVDRFDFAFLRFHGGRFGAAALERLRTRNDGPDAASIAEKAGTVLAARSEYDAQVSIHRLTPEERAANITVAYPKGQSLPASFLQQDWPDLAPSHRCISANVKCDAVMLDLDGDGTAEILLGGPPNPFFSVYKEIGGKWKNVGTLDNSQCEREREKLLAGNFELVAPEFKDVRIDGTTLQLQRHRRTCR